MKKIVCFAFWFGNSLPKNFTVWLRTAGFNTDIDFIIFSNINSSDIIPDNVKIINIEYVDFEKKIMTYFGESEHYDNPYKICETRPFWGEIFYDIVQPYEFWGTIDLDIVMGNIRHFITDDVLERFDRILTLDHLSLYRVSSHLSNLLLNHGFSDIPEINEVLKMKEIFAFGEWPGASTIFSRLQVAQYNEKIVDDIWHLKKNLTKSDVIWLNKKNKKKIKASNYIFLWDGGQLIEIHKVNGNLFKKEVAYIHLQKRVMTLINVVDYFQKMLIVPNKYVVIDNMTDDAVEKIIKKGLRTQPFYRKYFDVKMSHLWERVKKN